jgi:hypothetical protein
MSILAIANQPLKYIFIFFSRINLGCFLAFVALCWGMPPPSLGIQRRLASCTACLCGVFSKPILQNPDPLELLVIYLLGALSSPTRMSGMLLLLLG